MNVADIKEGVIYYGSPESHRIRALVESIGPGGYDDNKHKMYVSISEVCQCDPECPIPEQSELENFAKWAQGIWDGELC